MAGHYEMSFPKFKGVPVAPMVDISWMEKMKDMTLRPDDIWVVCYPRSGTNWTSHIVRLILNRGQDDGKKLSDAVPWVEGFHEHYYTNIDEKPSPRVFRSHFIYEHMPCGIPKSTPCRYICVARNPKDVLVSYFFYLKGHKVAENVTWEEYFDYFMAGKLPYGHYFEHVLSWWQHRHDKNVLFLKYEDMKKDLSTTVADIADFIGQDINKALIDDIADKAMFTNMQADSTVRVGFPQEVVLPGTAFFRKGAVGDWKTHLTVEQIAKIDKACEDKLKPAGLSFDFEI